MSLICDNRDCGPHYCCRTKNVLAVIRTHHTLCDWRAPGKKFVYSLFAQLTKHRVSSLRGYTSGPACDVGGLTPYPPPPTVPQQVRSGTSTNSFMMVDSPGMIDSPMSRSIYDRSRPDDSTGPRRGSDTSRGYDFEGVVRWFAERADVILLFFDPDKPGTTGETLSILTNSLPGMDHKLYIVLNKVRVLPCSACRHTATRSSLQTE